MPSEARSTAPITRRDLEAKIVALAWKDDDFRTKFLSDPKAQFEEKLGTKLPAALVITAHGEDENHLHFVIPAKPRENLDELSEEDLEKVAGGTDVTVAVIGGLFALGAAIIGGTAGIAGAGIQRGW
jgi:hypothetical protein